MDAIQERLITRRCSQEMVVDGPAKIRIQSINGGIVQLAVETMGPVRKLEEEELAEIAMDA